jgi:Ser/Thr protein kinase RdoA (MazF antagonist)
VQTPGLKRPSEPTRVPQHTAVGYAAGSVMAGIDDILRGQGLDGPAVLLAQQGQGTVAYATERHVIKIARAGCSDQVLTEALVAPAARAAGVRTPALLAWASLPDLAYSVWERVPGEPLGDRRDPEVWRDVGRELARLHAMDLPHDPRGVLRKSDKRDARPYLRALPPELADLLARWLSRCDAAAPAPERLAHYDVHGLNVFGGADGRATLIDWADAAWADPAADFGSLRMPDVPHVLAGYEEVAPLGAGAEGRILRAVIGQAARKLVTSAWAEPLDDLLAWAREGPSTRFREWLPGSL